MKKLWIFVALTLFLVNLTSKSYAEKVVAEVGPYKLSAQELEEIMKNDPQIKEILKAKPELKPQVERGIIERWLNISLLALGAKEETLKDDPKVRQRIEEAEKMILAEEYLQKELKGIQASEEELKAYYEKNKAQYKEAEGIKLKHILIYVPKEADNKTREKALTRAKQIRGQLAKGAKFEELAKIHSDDTASKEKGGDLGILRRGETLPEFEEKVFKLKVGEISEPIASPYGYHIVKVEKRIPEEILPFEKVKDQVKQDLLKEKEREVIGKALEKIKQKYPPKIYIERESKEGAR